jgi:glycine/D-amino acid oxidase-like deaminating enzyme
VTVSALPRGADAVVVGAGMVGAACALYLARAGLRPCVVERGAPASGTTSAGEGNILVSDKLPGPELALALHGLALWQRLAEELDTGDGGASAAMAGPGRAGEPLPAASRGGFEMESKGGLVVAHDGAQLDALRTLAAAQRAAGVLVEPADPAGLLELEPCLAPDLAGGALYRQDCQVQPMLATASLLAEACRLGATLVTRTEVLAAERGHGGAVAALITDRGRVAAPVVVNAAGPWSAEVASRLGTRLPVRPRRGHILVTEPLPPVVRRKVYEGDYVDAVQGDSEDAAACSAVVEGTASGTILIGSSREFSGFDRRPNHDVLAELARRATRLFPFLARVRALRAYLGFRPASPDHLPIIGPDPAAPGIWHASGHEGAGIGLAPATGELLTALITGSPPAVDPVPFAPARFAAPATAQHG